MKILCAILLMLALRAAAQIEVVAEKEPQSFFHGEQHIRVTFRNNTKKDFSSAVRMRLYQESSATAMPIGEPQLWKNLRVLAGQTVVEHATVAFPWVRAGTAFYLQWIDEQDQAIGKSTVRIYPETVLKSLSALASDSVIGILDPENVLKPLLKTAGVKFHDLETGAGFDEFKGSLAIVGPFVTKQSIPENLHKRILERIKAASITIVWIQPAAEAEESPLSFSFAQEQRTNIAFVQPEVVANLKESPRAQLNLVRVVQMATNPSRLLESQRKQ